MKGTLSKTTLYSPLVLIPSRKEKHPKHHRVEGMRAFMRKKRMKLMW